MPTTSTFTGGVATSNSIAVPVQLPSIERQAVAIESISVVRGGGRLFTDGDQALVGLSHQTDIRTVDLLDDQDDIISEIDPNPYDLWWIHGLSEIDHATDHLAVPELVAGPQTLIWVNNTGGTTSVRLLLSWRFVPVKNLTEWSLLKQRTSYEHLV